MYNKHDRQDVFVLKTVLQYVICNFIYHYALFTFYRLICFCIYEYNTIKITISTQHNICSNDHIPHARTVRARTHYTIAKYAFSTYCPIRLRDGSPGLNRSVHV